MEQLPLTKAPEEVLYDAIANYTKTIVRKEIRECLSYFELIASQIPTKYTTHIIEDILYKIKTIKKKHGLL